MKKLIEEREKDLIGLLELKVKAAVVTLNSEQVILTEICEKLTKLKKDGIELRWDIEKDKMNMYGIVNLANPFGELLKVFREY